MATFSCAFCKRELATQQTDCDCRGYAIDRFIASAQNRESIAPMVAYLTAHPDEMVDVLTETRAVLIAARDEQDQKRRAAEHALDRIRRICDEPWADSPAPLSDAPELPTSRGHARSAGKTDAILGSAKELFLSDGYTRTSMDSIAARAGVSKQTVYSHFADKDTLFAAVVASLRSEAGANRALALPSHAADVRAELTTFGIDLLKVLLVPEVASLRRLIIGELTQRVELRRTWSDGAPEDAAIALRDYLTAANTAALLAVEDPEPNARQFITLISAEGLNKSVYGVRPLSDQDRRAIAERCVDLFVRAHRAG